MTASPPDSVAAVAITMDGLLPSALLRECLLCLKPLLSMNKEEITAIVLPFGEGRSDTIPLCWQSCL